MLSVPHLDRDFDYLVSAEQSDDAQPGVRVRVRFHGRLVDAFVLERRSDTDHDGKLGWLDRVVSSERGADPRRPPARRRGRRPVRGHPRRRAAARGPAAARERREADRARARPRRRLDAGRPDGVGDVRPRRAVPRRARRGPGRPRGLAGAAGGAVDRPARRGRRGGRALGPRRRWRSCPTSATSTRCTPPRSGTSTRRAVVALSAGLGPSQRVPPLAVGAARPRPVRHRHPQRGLRAGRRPRSGDGVGRRRRQPGRTAGALPARPRGGDAARAPAAVRRVDRRLRPHRRGAGAGARAGGRTTWWPPGRWCGPARRGWSRSTTAASPRNATPPPTPRGCRRWRSTRRARRCRPDARCSSRCRGAATCPRWPAASAGPSPGAGTARDRCRCPTATPRERCAGGAAAPSSHCAACGAVPTRCAPSSSARAAPPRNWAGRFPAPPSSPPAATR